MSGVRSDLFKIRAVCIATGTGGIMASANALTTMPTMMVHSSRAELEMAKQIMMAQKRREKRKVILYPLGYKKVGKDSYTPLVAKDHPLYRYVGHGAGKRIEVGSELWRITEPHLMRTVERGLKVLGAINLVFFVDSLGGGTGSALAVEFPTRLMEWGYEVLGIYTIPWGIDRDAYNLALETLRKVKDAGIPSVIIDYNSIVRTLKRKRKTFTRKDVYNEAMKRISVALESIFNLFRDIIPVQSADVRDITRCLEHGFGVMGVIEIPYSMWRFKKHVETVMPFLEPSLLADLYPEAKDAIQPDVFLGLDGPWTASEEEAISVDIDAFWKPKLVVKYVTGDEVLQKKILVHIAGGYDIDHFQFLNFIPVE